MEVPASFPLKPLIIDVKFLSAATSRRYLSVVPTSGADQFAVKPVLPILLAAAAFGTTIA